MLSDKFDQLQFSYDAKRGVNDASLTLTLSLNIWTVHTHTLGFYPWTFLLILKLKQPAAPPL